MTNKIWSYFIIIGILYTIITNNIETLNIEILNSTKTSLNMILDIFPVMALWLGIMNIANTSGLLQKISKFISPVVGKIFNEIPKNHETLSLISSNIILNMLGLGNAATPIGLKTMNKLKELNNNRDSASNSMITFLAMNTSGLTLIPTTVISLRIMHGSINPTEIVLACIVSTFLSTLTALTLDRIFRRLNHD